MMRDPTTFRRRQSEQSMGERKNLCVLVVEIVGGPTTNATTSGALEIRHAIDRCLRRVELAIEANAGSVLLRDRFGISATFERCDPAILAACEMLERTQNLPPLRGKRFSISVGIHYGTVGTGQEDAGEGLEIARRLARASRSGEALATGAAVLQLSATTRHFARPSNNDKAKITDLEWPIFSIARQPESVISLPPATRLLQRLRIRHQNEIIFVDELRPIVLLGRELGNDIVIMDPRASRQHARVERRRGGFMLIDQSTNGTCLLEDDAVERCIKGSEVALVGPGRIGCGFSANDVERDLVFFDIV